MEILYRNHLLETLIHKEYQSVGSMIMILPLWSIRDGAVLYSMSLNQFKKFARDADAVYKYGKMVLVNTKIVDEYLEYFHVQMDE